VEEGGRSELAQSPIQQLEEECNAKEVSHILTAALRDLRFVRASRRLIAGLEPGVSGQHLTLKTNRKGSGRLCKCPCTVAFLALGLWRRLTAFRWSEPIVSCQSGLNGKPATEAVVVANRSDIDRFNDSHKQEESHVKKI